MKKLVLASAALLFGFAVMAQKKVDDVVKFKTEVYDFGKIKQGIPVTTEFVFTNISKEPVVIESATASCGCTTPVKPEAPVMAGAENKIIAGFNAANPQPFDKTISVKIAGIDEMKVIKIKGEVLDAAAYDAYIKANPPKPLAATPVATTTKVTKKSKKTAAAASKAKTK
jgi:uncharacterized secreted protein with C-terminal beta-propeller domain